MARNVTLRAILISRQVPGWWGISGSVTGLDVQVDNRLSDPAPIADLVPIRSRPRTNSFRVHPSYRRRRFRSG